MGRVFVLLPVLLLSIVLPLEGRHYLVELRDNAPAESATTTTTGTGATANRHAARDRALRLRSSMRDKQERSRAALGLAPQRILARLDFLFNAFIVDLNDSEAAAFRSHPEIRDLHPLPENRSRFTLDRANTLLGVPEAWNLAPPGTSQGAGVKIGIIDSVYNTAHPAFQDPDLTVPPGFPKGNNDEDLAKTTNKVIVYRTYGQLTGAAENGPYHGTVVASAAAGSAIPTPIGTTLSGIAPKAWLGFYQLGDEIDLYVLRAFEDAVADGMDILNFSLGLYNLSRPENLKPFDLAADRAALLGTSIVWAAGNFGHERTTVTSHSNSESTLIVGGLPNVRTIGGLLKFDADGAIGTVFPFDDSILTPDGEPIAGEVHTLSEIDNSPQAACTPLPEGKSLQGWIVLVDQTVPCDGGGIRTANLAAAGAAAIIMYRKGEGLRMNPGPSGAEAPAVVISQAAVEAIEARRGASATLIISRTSEQPPLDDPNAPAPLSSRGPTLPDYKIRPDVLGIAQHVYTSFPEGEFEMVSGTSMAAPMVAGGLALLKAARPELTPPQLYSLITNTADPLPNNNHHVMEAGAGRMNAANAIRSTLTAFPRSLSLGIISGSTTTTTALRELALTNIGSTPETVQIRTTPLAEGKPVPQLSLASATIEPGATVRLNVRFAPAGPPPAGGEYEGFIHVTGTSTGVDLRIPYWFAVPTGVPSQIKVVIPPEFYAGGTYLFSPLLPEFRVLDTSGIPITTPLPQVTVVSGDATVLDVVPLAASFVPGAFNAQMRFGSKPGETIIRIRAGSLTKDVKLNVVTPVKARMEVDTYQFSFGEVLSGLSKDYEYRITNTGGEPLVITRIDIPDARFRLITPTLPLTIARGATQRLLYRFTPGNTALSTAADVTTTITFYSNDVNRPVVPMALSARIIPPAGPLTLAVDNDRLGIGIGYPGGADTAYFVNRLTPPKYPAVLQSIRIFFANRTDALRAGTPVTAIARPNPGGTQQLESFSFVQIPGTIAATGAYQTFTLSPSQQIRIDSGDFVVGFTVNNPPNTFPVELDRSTASQRRSYVSNSGQFSLVDIDAGIPGNFIIRAIVTFP